MPPRFVHRAHTRAELVASDRCVVCARATSRVRDVDFGRGASTLYLTCALPEIRLCDACESEQTEAMKIGRKAVAIAMVAPLAFVLLAAVVAPFGSPLVVALAGLLGLVASRAVVGRVRMLRARASRVLFVDGVESEIILQLRLPNEDRAPMPYRQEGREPRADGVVVTPIGPRVRATLAFVASTLAVSVATVVAWFGSYPTLFVDNPTSKDVEVVLDGTTFTVPASAAARRTVSWGTHRFAIDPAARDDAQSISVPWGRTLLVSLATTPSCYEVRGPMRLGQREVGETARTAMGPTIVMDQSERAIRSARCAP